ncbi:tyrosine-type recombinase/integrase [Cellulomonas sp. NPDC057328]|uniref:tyrosine-type recombinase/integrase n=1 Tax=Cellulomonas sp. NPDC057328 TaxID=3346101 RepID=UPI00363B5CFB
MDGRDEAGRGRRDDDPPLRHTAASLLIAAGAGVKAVPEILGHSTSTMTMDRYEHLSSDATWQAMERLLLIPLMQAPRENRTGPQGWVRTR